MDNEEFDAQLKAMIPEAATYLKDTGCLKCDLLPGTQMCLDCRLDLADQEVCAAMRNREELEQEKERTRNEKL